MSALPKFAGQSCCGAGAPSSSSSSPLSFGQLGRRLLATRTSGRRSTPPPRAAPGGTRRPPGSRPRCGRRSTARSRRSGSRRRRRSRRRTRRPGCSALLPRASPEAPRLATANGPTTPSGPMLACTHHADRRVRVRRPLGGRRERRGERVVDHVHVRAVRRDRGRRVVPAVARALDAAPRPPRRAAVARRRELHALGAQPGAAVGVGHDDLVRSRPRPNGAPLAMSTDGPAPASLRSPPTPSIMQRKTDTSKPAHWSLASNSLTGAVQVDAAVAGGHHDLLAGHRRARRLRRLLVGEHVHLAVRVGPDRAVDARVAGLRRLPRSACRSRPTGSTTRRRRATSRSGSAGRRRSR